MELGLELLQHLDSSLGGALDLASCHLDLWGWRDVSPQGAGLPGHLLSPSRLCQVWHLVAFIPNGI